MKRFWDQATPATRADGHAILLDGKPMRVPGGAELLVRSPAIAHAIAGEWQRAGGHKGGEMTMDDVPLTRLAGTAQERIAPDPAPVADALAAYAATDLLCYRAEQPLALVLRQSREWQPWLDWLETTHGARLQPTEGLVPLVQDDAALARIRDRFRALDPDRLAALGVAIPALGSAVLGLALADGALDADQAHALASLDELFQESQWGADPWSANRRAGLLADVALADRFLALLRAPAEP